MTVPTRAFDSTLFCLALVASVAGLALIYDAAYANSIQAGGSPFPVEVRGQAIWLAVAVGVSLICSRVNPRIWKMLAPLAWFAALGFLLAVKFSGHSSHGSSRWFAISKFQFQPSEFAKLAVVLYLATVFANRKPWTRPTAPLRDFIDVLELVWWPKLVRFVPALLLLVAFALIESEPDLGTAAIVAVTGFAMFFPGGVSKWSLGLAICLGLAGGIYMATKETYRVERFAEVSAPMTRKSINGVGFQGAQSKYAQARGGLFGVGLGAGAAKHILPATTTTTDYILATVGEEFGLCGSLSVLALLGAIVWRAFYLASRATNRFAMLVPFGFGIWIAIQTTVNFMMASSLLPSIGIPAPFFSAGGSSLMALWIGIGICQSAQIGQVTPSVP